MTGSAPEAPLQGGDAGRHRPKGAAGTEFSRQAVEQKSLRTRRCATMVETNAQNGFVCVAMLLASRLGRGDL